MSPVVGSGRENYCTPADLIGFGVSDDKATEEVCDTASRIIDNYTGQTFTSAPTERTVTIHDVRNARLPLPSPFRDVTSVKINGVPLDSGGWVADDQGLRLVRYGAKDVDGFPIRDPGRRGLRVAYGSVVTVTATFGYETLPSPLRRAAVLIAAQMANTHASQIIDPRIRSRSVEGFSESYGGPGEGGGFRLDSTGSAEADMLCAAYVIGGAQVG